VDCTIKSTKKLDLDISGSLNKSKIPGYCGFPLGNPQKWQMMDFVPESILCLYAKILGLVDERWNFLREQGTTNFS
jgi:hypothetical protein